MKKGKELIQQELDRIDGIFKAKELLFKEGYYIGNLWHIDDVKNNYDCDDEDAYNILNQAVASEYVQEQIFGAIDEIAFQYELKEKDEEDE